MNKVMVTFLRVVIDKNLKSRVECLPFIEFAYNRDIHSTTHCLPFEVIYGFNSLTPLDLLHMPPNKFANLEAESKVAIMHSLHREVNEKIEKNNNIK